MFGIFKKKIQEGKALPNKDPNDYTLTESSTPWKADSSFCRVCKKTTSHSEFMSGVCNGCGSFNDQPLYRRSHRKLYIDGKWKVQYKYKNGDMEIVEKEY